MTYKSKRQCVITIENVCLTLAIINAIATGLALMGSCIATFIFIVLYVQSNSYANIRSFEGDTLFDGDLVYPDDSKFDVALDAYEPPMSELAGVFLGMLALVSLISFVFSALLCNGIYNRRPGQVKAFFIFGVIMILLEAQISAVGLFKRDYLRAGLFGLLGCGIYSLFLVLVYRTYLKITKDAMYKKHVRLLES